MTVENKRKDLEIVEESQPEDFGLPPDFVELNRRFADLEDGKVTEV